MIKGILFDLDNTLIDFMTMKKKSCEAAVSAMIGAGVELEKEDALRVLFELYDEHGWEYSLIFQRFLEKIKKRIDYKILAAGVIAYRKAQQAFMQPYAGVVPTLLKLKQKGIKLAIVTDAPRLKAWMRLTELGLHDFFDVVVAYGDVRERKPSKLPFLRALKLLELDAVDVLMVGDWPERDIVGARAVRIQTCFARYGYTGKEGRTVKAQYTIDQIEELVGIVG